MSIYDKRAALKARGIHTFSTPLYTGPKPVLCGVGMPKDLVTQALDALVAGDTKACMALLQQLIEAAASSPAPAKPKAAPVKPKAPPAPAPGPALSKRELAMCAEMKVDPKVYAAKKSNRNRKA